MRTIKPTPKGRPFILRRLIVMWNTGPSNPLPIRIRAPAGRLASVLPILARMLLIVGLPIMNWILFFIWLAIGLVIYSSYSRKRSMLREGSGVVQS
jgi:hypothetical protein